MTFFENELVVCIKQPKSYTEKYLEMIELARLLITKSQLMSIYM
jgi:hypothetical protein